MRWARQVATVRRHYEEAGAYHQLKNLACTKAAFNTFILARDDQPNHLIRTLLPHVEHAVLGLHDDRTGLEMGVPTRGSPYWMTLGAATISFRPEAATPSRAPRPPSW